MSNVVTTNMAEELGFQPKALDTANKAMVEAAEAKAVAEVQAKYIIAKKFPRNEYEATQRIYMACKRKNLAEQSQYVYSRGGTEVSGPSIRLAEALAQGWGNIDFGITEISRTDNVSVVEAYAIDLETNSRSTKTFHVEHVRDTKQGLKKLNSTRDIYELVANQGARRLRACILALIPGDIIDAAVKACENTLMSSDEPLDQQIKKITIALSEFGVKVEHIEKRLGHKLNAASPAEIVKLKAVYKSLKDGFADVSQYFELGDTSKEQASKILEQLSESNAKG